MTATETTSDVSVVAILNCFSSTIGSVADVRTREIRSGCPDVHRAFRQGATPITSAATISFPFWFPVRILAEICRRAENFEPMSVPLYCCLSSPPCANGSVQGTASHFNGPFGADLVLASKSIHIYRSNFQWLSHHIVHHHRSSRHSEIKCTRHAQRDLK